MDGLTIDARILSNRISAVFGFPDASIKPARGGSNKNSMPFHGNAVLFATVLCRVGSRARFWTGFHEVQKEIKMPEYVDWSGQDRLGVNIDVAYKSAQQ
jgi:hypothetical protein